MKIGRVQAISSIGILLALGAAVCAAEGEGSWPLWNPFGSKKNSSEKKATASVSDQPGGWRLPKLPPLPKLSMPSVTGNRTSVARRTPPSPGPSMWDKMTKSTKDFFSKTYDALTPWDNNKQTTPHKPPTHPGSVSRSSSNKRSWWFSRSESGDAKEPQTVNEFIAQPRVTP